MLIGLASAPLLAAALAPWEQFYLAWVGLVPWLMLVGEARSGRSAFAWSWVAGTLYFGLVICWLVYVTAFGTAASAVYMGLYWAAAALLLRWLIPHRGGGAWPDCKGWSSLAAVLIAGAVWAGLESIRSRFLTGWPWAMLGHSQTPLLPLVQIADLTGVFGVSFILASANMLGMLLLRTRGRIRPVWPAAVGVAAMVALAVAYGTVRLGQADQTGPGPRVLLVQSNFPQSNTGAKGASEAELIEYHIQATRRALDAERAAGRSVELVVWSETMVPEINPQAAEGLRLTRRAPMLRDVLAGLSRLADDYDVPLLVGGTYAASFREDREGFVIPSDRRNVAYYLDRSGRLAEHRYDKVHLVPFGEYIPLTGTFPWVYEVFTSLGLNPHEFDYTLQAGGLDDLTVFEAPAGDVGFRFVTPICFEDADAWLVARMIRPQDGQTKRAGLIVNITNDGWFAWPQLWQHLQIARFRSIENRVPTARSVNTGISALIDSSGRASQQLGAQTEGVLIGQVALDSRLTLYTRFGDLFALGCCLVVGALAVARGGRAIAARRAGARADGTDEQGKDRP